MPRTFPTAAPLDATCAGCTKKAAALPTTVARGPTCASRSLPPRLEAGGRLARHLPAISSSRKVIVCLRASAPLRYCYVGANAVVCSAAPGRWRGLHHSVSARSCPAWSFGTECTGTGAVRVRRAPEPSVLLCNRERSCPVLPSARQPGPPSRWSSIILWPARAGSGGARAQARA
jgi:hypothetical protein